MPEETEADIEPAADEDATELVAGGGDDDDDDDEDVEDEPAAQPVAARPIAPTRSQPNRPPSAREEPPPPFNIGERVVLTSNTRPRTGAPIGDHEVGAPGRVETVLSQTAVVRFDRAPERKEVVAFTCLQSTDPEAQARRKAEARALARAKREAETAADQA